MKKILVFMIFVVFLIADEQDAKQKLKELQEQLETLQSQVAEKKGELNFVKKSIEDRKKERDAAKENATNETSDSGENDEKKQELEQKLQELKSKLAKYKNDRDKYKKYYLKYSGLSKKLESKRKSSKQTSNKQTSNKQTSNKQTSNKQSSNKQVASNKQSSNKQSSNKQSSNKQSSNKQSSNKQTSNKQVVSNKQTGNKQTGSQPKPPKPQKGNIVITPAQIAKIKEIDAIKNRPVDYKKIVTANKCGECHKQEKEVWKKTPHFKTFDAMSKKSRAKGIFKKLKLKGSIKRSGRCSKCHFLQQHNGRSVRAVAGVSCESCHGAGKDWIYIHNDRTVPKGPRRIDAMSKGMNNPSDIYLIAQNCYGCHSVPDEDLVNIGGHKPGSAFELVSWSQGMVRHNFIRSGNKENQKSTPQRLRVMFVTGLMLDLEYSLRGLLKATKNGKYAQNMMGKVNKTFQTLTIANSKSGGITEVGELLALFGKLNLKNRQHLQAGANLVTLKAREFTKNHDGSKLGALDQFIPKSYK